MNTVSLQMPPSPVTSHTDFDMRHPSPTHFSISPLHVAIALLGSLAALTYWNRGRLKSVNISNRDLASLAEMTREKVKRWRFESILSDSNQNMQIIEMLKTPWGKSWLETKGSQQTLTEEQALHLQRIGQALPKEEADALFHPLTNSLVKALPFAESALLKRTPTLTFFFGATTAGKNWLVRRCEVLNVAMKPTHWLSVWLRETKHSIPHSVDDYLAASSPDRVAEFGRDYPKEVEEFLASSHGFRWVKRHKSAIVDTSSFPWSSEVRSLYPIADPRFTSLYLEELSQLSPEEFQKRLTQPEGSFSTKVFQSFLKCSKDQWLKQHASKIWFTYCVRNLVGIISEVYLHTLPADWEIEIKSARELSKASHRANEWLLGPHGRRQFKRFRTEIWELKRREFSRLRELILKEWPHRLNKYCLSPGWILATAEPHMLVSESERVLEFLFKTSEGEDWLAQHAYHLWFPKSLSEEPYVSLRNRLRKLKSESVAESISTSLLIKNPEITLSDPVCLANAQFPEVELWMIGKRGAKALRTFRHEIWNLSDQRFEQLREWMHENLPISLHPSLYSDEMVPHMTLEKFFQQPHDFQEKVMKKEYGKQLLQKHALELWFPLSNELPFYSKLRRLALLHFTSLRSILEQIIPQNFSLPDGEIKRLKHVQSAGLEWLKTKSGQGYLSRHVGEVWSDPELQELRDFLQKNCPPSRYPMLYPFKETFNYSFETPSKREIGTFLQGEIGTDWIESHLLELWFPLKVDRQRFEWVRTLIRGILPTYSFSLKWRDVQEIQERLFSSSLQPEAFEWLKGREGRECLKFYREEIENWKTLAAAELRSWKKEHLPSNLYPDLYPYRYFRDLHYTELLGESKKDFNTFMRSEHGKQWMQNHVRELWFPLAPEGKAHMKLVRAVRSIYPEYSFPADWKIAMHNPELLLHVQPEAFNWLRGPEGQETLKRHRNKLWIEERERYTKIKQWMLKNFSEEILKDLLPTFREIFDVVTPEELMHFDPVEIDFLLKSKEGLAWIIDNRHTIWDAQTVRQNGPLTELQKTLLCLYPIQEDENEKLYPQTLRTSDSWKRDGIERVNLMIFCQQGFSRFHPKATIDEVGEKILTLYSLGIKVAEIRIAYFHEETADGGGPLRSYFSEALYALSQRQKCLKDFGCPAIEGTFDSQFFVKLGATLGCLYDLKIPTGSLFSPDVYRSFFIPLEGSKIRLNAKSLSEISSFRKLLGADDGGVMAPKLFDILSLIAKWEVIDESDPSWSSCRVNYLTQYSEVKGDLDVVIETELVPQMSEESLKFCGDSFLQSQAAVKALRSYYITVLGCLLKIPEKFEAISHLHSGLSLLVEMPSDPVQFMRRMQGTCSSKEILKVLNFKTTPRDLTQKIECWLEENMHHSIALETFLYNLTGSRTLPIEMVNGAERELLVTVFSPVCDDFGTVLSDQKIHTCSRWMETPYPSTLPATLSLTQQCQNKLQDFLDLCYRGVLLDHNAY